MHFHYFLVAFSIFSLFIKFFKFYFICFKGRPQRSQEHPPQAPPQVLRPQGRLHPLRYLPQCLFNIFTKNQRKTMKSYCIFTRFHNTLKNFTKTLIIVKKRWE